MMDRRAQLLLSGISVIWPALLLECLILKIDALACFSSSEG